MQKGWGVFFIVTAENTTRKMAGAGSCEGTSQKYIFIGSLASNPLLQAGERVKLATEDLGIFNALTLDFAHCFNILRTHFFQGFSLTGYKRPRDAALR